MEYVFIAAAVFVLFVFLLLLGIVYGGAARRKAIKGEMNRVKSEMEDAKKKMVLSRDEIRKSLKGVM